MDMKCRKSNAQSYECQVYCKPPFEVIDICGDVKENQNIAFDVCLGKELFWLWDNGIETVGCCCGKHQNVSKERAFIQVKDKYINDMKKLGYIQIIDSNNKNCFVPKTNL